MKTRAYLLWIVCLLALMQPALAQNDFVGDGFGGRLWYKPANIVGGYQMAASVVNGQLYMWAGQSAEAYLMPIPFNASPSSFPISGGLTNTGSTDQTSPVDINAMVLNRGDNLRTLKGNYVYPYAVPNFSDVKLIDIMTLGAMIKNDGTGWVWGAPNGFGSNNTYVGSFNGNLDGFHKPVQVISNAKHVSVGRDHIAFVKDDGTVWSLGDNRMGNYGNNTAIPGYVPTNNPGVATLIAMSTTPVQMTGITNAVRVAAFGGVDAGVSTPSLPSGTVVLKQDGTVWVAGAGGVLVTNNPNLTPKQVLGLPKIVDIKCAYGNAVALSASGDVYMWGRNIQTGVVNATPQKVNFAVPDPPNSIVAIEARSFSSNSAPTIFAIDDTHRLWVWTGGLTTDGVLSGTDISVGYSIPHLVAKNVADVNSYHNGAYLTRTTDYPANERLWLTSMSGGGAITGLMSLNPSYYATAPDWLTNNYWSKDLNRIGSNVWAPCDPGAWGPGFSEIGTVETPAAAGVIDCSKTQIVTAPVVGSANQLSLVVTMNVSATGTFSPVTVSGSGMSLANGVTSITATKTGIQQFQIPINYDGTALTSGFQFTIGSSGSCSADLTQKSNPIITNVWTLNNCSAITPGVLSKQGDILTNKKANN